MSVIFKAITLESRHWEASLIYRDNWNELDFWMTGNCWVRPQGYCGLKKALITAITEIPWSNQYWRMVSSRRIDSVSMKFLVQSDKGALTDIQLKAWKLSIDFQSYIVNVVPSSLWNKRKIMIIQYFNNLETWYNLRGFQKVYFF